MPGRTGRDADTELAGTLAYSIRDNAVDSDQRKQRCHSGEDSDQESKKTLFKSLEALCLCPEIGQLSPKLSGNWRCGDRG